MGDVLWLIFHLQNLTPGHHRAALSGIYTARSLTSGFIVCTNLLIPNLYSLFEVVLGVRHTYDCNGAAVPIRADVWLQLLTGLLYPSFIPLFALRLSSLSVGYYLAVCILEQMALALKSLLGEKRGGTVSWMEVALSGPPPCIWSRQMHGNHLSS